MKVVSPAQATILRLGVIAAVVVFLMASTAWGQAPDAVPPLPDGSP